MIGAGIYNLMINVLTGLPVLNIPYGFTQALSYLTNVVGFINVFLPLTSLVPIILLIIAVRNFNIVMSIINWIIRTLKWKNIY